MTWFCVIYPLRGEGEGGRGSRGGGGRGSGGGGGAGGGGRGRKEDPLQLDLLIECLKIILHVGRENYRGRAASLEKTWEY